MVDLPPAELKEMNIRLFLGQPQLAELTWRHVNAQTVAMAAHGIMNDPQKANEQWKNARAEFFAAAAMYRSASDAMMVFHSSDLADEWEEKLGRFLLSKGNRWQAAQKAERESIAKQVEKIYRTVSLLPLAKPKEGLSAKQVREQMLLDAMKEAGWDERADEQERRSARVRSGGVKRAGGLPDEKRGKPKAAQRGRGK